MTDIATKSDDQPRAAPKVDIYQKITYFTIIGDPKNDNMAWHANGYSEGLKANWGYSIKMI